MPLVLGLTFTQVHAVASFFGKLPPDLAPQVYHANPNPNPNPSAAGLPSS